MILEPSTPERFTARLARLDHALTGVQDRDAEAFRAGLLAAALDRIGPDGSDFEVVFSDVVMPGMGGIEFARLLRPRLPRLPVVLASGYSHVLAQEGAHGFELLRKPYSAEQVSHVLRKAVGRDERVRKGEGDGASGL